MLATLLLAATLHAGTAPVLQVQSGPSPEALGDSVELGGLAALAPLCGLRDEAWSADLRRSAIQTATGTRRHDDAALKAAPGSNQVIGALSYAALWPATPSCPAPTRWCATSARGHPPPNQSASPFSGCERG